MASLDLRLDPWVLREVPLNLGVDPFVLVVPFDPDVVVPLQDYEFASFVAVRPRKKELYRIASIFFT